MRELADLIIEVTGSMSGVQQVTYESAYGGRFEDSAPTSARHDEGAHRARVAAHRRAAGRPRSHVRMVEGDPWLTSTRWSRLAELVVGVVGLGYVGLPLAMAAADAGFSVLGFDLDAERSAALNAGISHIEDVSSERLGLHTDSGRFRAAADPSALAAAGVIFICVPTPADRHQTPDLSYVRAALTSVAPC